MQHQVTSFASYGAFRTSTPPPPISPFSGAWRNKTRGIKTETGGTRLPRHAAIVAQLELKPLPYSLDCLEPHMTRQTLELHWGGHHRAHVVRLNNLIAGTDLDGKGLEDILLATYNKGNPLPAFVHAAQVWNHDFFWQSIKPNGGGHPSGKLMELIERDFGSFDTMLENFKQAAVTQFGSGWAWLAYKANKLDVGNAVNPCPSEKDNRLVVLKSPNAINPLIWNYAPLLAVDVWEHAYYLDYENRRADFVSVFVEKLVSWEVVSHRLRIAMEQAAERARKETREDDDEEATRSDAVEMYLDNESDDSETE
ncbi:superoxide dismutase [Fe], chloroplastic-like [Zingiber officinale]|uniref:superoxide dismutase [Fe], chloroplastic-like n=1 Tax=Zingiber officinale TaxID=94328 RepID=UPI001C4B46BB|nr:superoxide dismutase [Fe], chloroplastic-like [Zingiber officinale]